MRNLVIGMAMASTALTAPAMAREGQWYIQGEAGTMVVDDISFEIDGVGDEASADVDSGFDFGGVVGYDFGAFRLETETSYRSASLDTLTAGASGLQSGALPNSVFVNQTRVADGDFTALSFMLNGLFDIGADNGPQIFAGGGIGVARVELYGFANPNGIPAFDGSDTGLAWQLIGGVRAPISDSWDVGLKYRYFNAVDVDFVDPNGRDFSTDVTSHSLLGTLTYNFGAGAAPAAAAPAAAVAPPAPPSPSSAPPPPPPAPSALPPAPPPPPPCNTGPYTVYFDFDQSDITDGAATILNQAVTSYANCGTASVMLAGHTDAAGSTTYNVALAKRRNASVQAYLVGRGIPEARITAEAFGESALDVPTANGVREQKNRRVVVTYGPNSGM